MQYASLDFLGLSLVPEIFTQITAGPARDVHFLMIFIVAIGALPLIIIVNDNLAVPPADMAIVALGIEFRILNVVVDETYDLLHRFQVVLHVRDLDI